MRWYLKVLRNVTLSGRASPTEFWMFVLVNVLVSVALYFVDHVIGLTLGLHRGIGFLQALYGLLVFFPGIAVAVRRLHDIGKSGWLLLVAFIPLVGGVLLLYWYCRDGDPGSNKFGAPAPR